MATYQQYSEIKELINSYWLLKKPGEYDVFIKKLVDILRI